MNGWVLSRWCPRGSTILSVCSGSGSMLEAAIHMGGSCIFIVCDGIYINMFFVFSLFRLSICPVFSEAEGGI